MKWLEQLLRHKIVRPIDVEFARFIGYGGDRPDPGLALLALMVSAELGRKNVCLALKDIDLEAPLGPLPREIELPPLGETLDNLEHCYCVRVSKPDIQQPQAPLVLYQRRLYLQRYWSYESSLAAMLKQRMSYASDVDPQFAARMLNRLFDPSDDIDWQKVACAVALLNRFSVITGGPGTGKTTTVTKLLALLVSQYLSDNPEQRPLIKLATPTGKAAARLSESIKGAKARLDIEPQYVQLIPDEASTIHRLLGVRPNSSEFVHNQNNPLHLDVLVVDEVSMVDLPLMAKLMAALPVDAKVVMLGDKDQLSSVEAGSVLADICGEMGLSVDYSPQMQAQIKALTGIELPPSNSDRKTLADCICLLHKSHRFDDKSGIGQLAKAVNRGDEAGLRHLAGSNHPSLSFAAAGQQEIELLVAHSAHAYQPYLQMLVDGAPIKEIIEAFNCYQVLCAVREGEFGVLGINQAIERKLATMGLISPKQQFYAGRPVMIGKNDYSLQLYNGDVGLILPDRNSGHLKAWFIDPQGEVRAVYPNRLPTHDAVYAMTVHKSQGSEFDEVALLLPPGSVLGNSRVVTRELVYTGITRAKKRFNLFADESVLSQAIGEKTQRASGLRGMIYNR